MDFKAYLVKTNSSTMLNLSLIGIIIFMMSFFCWPFAALETLGLFLLIVGILMVLIGAIANKGKGLFEVDNQLVIINDHGIEIRSVLYNYSDIKNLEFYFHSYYSQSPYGYYTENAGLIEYGMANTLSFKNKDVEITERFVLPNQFQANLFLSMLEALKARGIVYQVTYRPFTR